MEYYRFRSKLATGLLAAKYMGGSIKEPDTVRRLTKSFEPDLTESPSL